jgi:starch-binding outer membrane protein, SusD/RagB family
MVMKNNTRNMKQSIFFSILTFGMLMAFVSCEDFYDKVPGDKVTPEEHYSSMKDLEISGVGILKIFQEVMPNIIMIDGLRSDMMDVTNNYHPDILELYNHDISMDNEFIDPSGFYRIIINVNEVLKHLDDVAANDKAFNEHERYFATIHLISFRSWAYFNLVRLYGEAAYIPDNMETYDPDYGFVYYTKDQMIDTLIKQMDTLTFPDPILFQGTKYIYDRALRGELYMEKGDYEKAIFHFQNAIGFYFNERSFKLNNFKLKSWENIHINAKDRSEEVMSAIEFSFSTLQDNPLFDWTQYSRKYYVKPTEYLVNLYEKQVAVNNIMGDPYRGKGITYDYVGIDSNLIINKYSLQPRGEFSGADIIMYRATDIHLLLAEALNQTGKYYEAMSIVNKGWREEWTNSEGVRGRVYLKNIEIDSTIVDSLTFIEDVIMEERAMELAYEGKRWFDLVRVANRRGESYLADKVAAKYKDPAKREEVRALLMDKKNWYLPFKK